jgi:hypothetical protein
METSIELMRMTGNELRQICDLSKKELNKDELKDLFGISRGTLYNYFDLEEKPVPFEIEEAVDKHPILREAKNKVIRKMETSPSINSLSEGTDIAKLLTDTIQVLRDVLVKSDKHLDALVDSNNHIREEAALYRRMVEDGYDSGLLQWAKKNGR